MKVNAVDWIVTKSASGARLGFEGVHNLLGCRMLRGSSKNSLPESGRVPFVAAVLSLKFPVPIAR